MPRINEHHSGDGRPCVWSGVGVLHGYANLRRPADCAASHNDWPSGQEEQPSVRVTWTTTEIVDHEARLPRSAVELLAARAGHTLEGTPGVTIELGEMYGAEDAYVARHEEPSSEQYSYIECRSAAIPPQQP